MLTKLLSFLDAKGSLSSKRLMSIIAVISACGITWVSLLLHIPIDGNELALVLGTIGATIGQQAYVNKAEVTKKTADTTD